jgi:uncharacterized membrane protein
MYSLFVPVTFAYSGAAAAGRIGMALQVGMALAGIASTWIVVRMPHMGMEFARCRRREFERLWRHSSIASLVAIFAGSIAVVCAATTLHWKAPPLLSRLPNVQELTFVMAWVCCGQIVLCLATYWRAMKRELTGPWGAIPGVVTGAAVWFGGRSYGGTGAVVGALTVSILLTLPLGLLYWRRAQALATEHFGNPL